MDPVFRAFAAQPTETKAHAAARIKAREFESVFLGQMAKLMMETAAPDGAYEGGHGEDMFRGIMAEQIGTATAAAGGVGLAPLVMDQIIKLQEGGANAL